VAPEDTRRRSALHPRCQNKVAPANRHRLSASKPRIGRPGGDRDRHYGVFYSRPECRSKGERHDEAREGQKNIGDAHQDRVEQSAEVARYGSDKQSDGKHDGRHEKNDEQGDAAAVNDAGQNVSPQFVRAEPVFG
jgi:hypothetical protein